MAETSAIGWTKSTFNPWIGCTKIGPGCDLCYAEQLDDKRLSKTLGGGTKEIPIKHWGAGAPRYRTSVQNWNLPLKWNRQAPDTEFAGRKGFWPVFCASLADVFDNEVPQEWREDLWKLIAATPNLSWLLVTKRIGNVRAMVPHEWMEGGFPRNVRIIATITDEPEAERDIDKLLQLPCHNGISYEPALGPVDWRPWLYPSFTPKPGTPLTSLTPYMAAGQRTIEWIIAGGESSQGSEKARIHDAAWSLQTIQQGRAAGVPIFEKQMGSNIRDSAGLSWPGEVKTCNPVWPVLREPAGKDMAEWPVELRVQEFPA